jgi:FKBP-type peptidyl-prolyl cis-trans isomerase FkpA
MLYNYNKSEMKKINSFLFALMGLLLLVACDNKGLKKTKSGILYNIISDKKNPVVKKGQFIKISFTQKISGVKDTVLISSDSSMPAYVPIDSVPSNAYSPVEIFSLLRKGDSAVAIQLVDSIMKRSAGQPLPPFLHKKDKIVLTLRVEDVFDNEELVKKDREVLLQNFHAKQIKQVENYLQQNNIQATKTPMGAYVQIKTPGDGPLIDSGKQVSVIYTGKLMPSGKQFQSNDEGDKEPFKFVLGRHMVIPGMEDGIQMLRKGSVATLYIPAFLAYDQQPGPGHTPNENLSFDIRIADVTDAPAENQMPMRPGAQSRPNMHPAPKPPVQK